MVWAGDPTRVTKVFLAPSGGKREKLMSLQASSQLGSQ